MNHKVKCLPSKGKPPAVVPHSDPEPPGVVSHSVQVTIQTCLASRYVKNIRPRVEEWDKALARCWDVIDEWVACQKAWMYLEFIFSSDDIKRQLPEESRKFAKIDTDFRALTVKTHEDGNCLKICTEEVRAARRHVVGCCAGPGREAGGDRARAPARAPRRRRSRTGPEFPPPPLSGSTGHPTLYQPKRPPDGLSRNQGTTFVQPPVPHERALEPHQSGMVAGL